MFLNNQFSQFASLENLKLQIIEGEVEVFSSSSYVFEKAYQHLEQKI